MRSDSGGRERMMPPDGAGENRGDFGIDRRQNRGHFGIDDGGNRGGIHADRRAIGIGDDRLEDRVGIGHRIANRLPVRLVHAIAAAIFAVLGVATLLGAGKNYGF